MLSYRKGDFIFTKNGKPFWPEDPRPEDIDMDAVISSLAKQPRWGGHVYGNFHYSIAQHSVLVSQALKEYGPLMELKGLLHDTGEFVIGEIVSPVKKLAPYLTKVEMQTLAAIHKHLDISGDPIPKEVHEADQRVFATEVLCLLNPAEFEWAHENKVKPYSYTIEPWNIKQSYEFFRLRFELLMYELEKEYSL